MRNVLLAAAIAVAAFEAAAQPWPARPVRVLVGLAAGGGTDLVMRALAPKLQEGLGQPVVVENRTGAGGAIAADAVAKSPPDGYTLLMAPSGSMVANTVMRRKLPYAPEDFTPVSLVCTFPLLVVADPKTPARTLAELVAFAKANPSRANASGSGPSFELPTALFAQRTGAPLKFVTYKGSNEAVQGIMSGDILMAIVDAGPALAGLKGGRLRALAVTSPARLPEFPEVPTVAEAGLPELEAEYWMALFAPARTPPEIVKRLEAELHKALALPEIRASFASKLVEARPSSPEAMAARVRQDIARWSAVRTAAGIAQLD